MVDTVQHPITTRQIPLIPASNQTHKDAKRQDKKRFAGRHAKDAASNSGQETIKDSVQPNPDKDSSTRSSGPERKKIDIVV
jgi:hypothetical protein